MLSDRIKQIIGDLGYEWQDRGHTLRTQCPDCGRSDKFSVLKKNGSCVCYRGSCPFGIQWFEDWIASTAKISRADAKRMLQTEGDRIDVPMSKDLSGPEESDKAVRWPAPETFSLDLEESAPGVKYLASRGIPMEVAEEYGIRYDIAQERVVLPVVASGECWGYQGRTIHPNVPKDQRMRSNAGFRRGLHLMFADRLFDSRHAILTEGPFDALKFHLAGGNVAALGKAVSDEQLRELRSYGVEAVYLALDEDAMGEMGALRQKLDVDVYLVRVPESCKARCAAEGRKADFGECTFEEALLAFNSAERVGLNYFEFM